MCLLVYFSDIGNVLNNIKKWNIFDPAKDFISSNWTCTLKYVVSQTAHLKSTFILY